MKRWGCAVRLVIAYAVFLGVAWAANPVVTVTSPVNNSVVGLSIHYVASATSSTCAKGIAAMRIYTAPHVTPFTVDSNHLDTSIALGPGNYNTVVQAWDNCGGVGKTTVNIRTANSVLPAPKFLYTTEFAANKVQGFSVNPSNGVLTPVKQGPVAAHVRPAAMATDQGGFRLYVANAGSHDLNAYFIDSRTGFLTPTPGSPYKISGTARSVIVHSEGKLVFVASDTSEGGSDGIDVFSVQSDGSLKAVAGSPFVAGTSPNSLTIDPTENYLYVGHEGTPSDDSSKIDAFSIDVVNGSLTPLPGEPYIIPTPDACISVCSDGVGELSIDVNGKYLVVTTPGNGATVVFSIDATTGMLTPVTGTPFVWSLPESPTDPGAEPASLGIDPQNQFAFITGTSCHDEGICDTNILSAWMLNSSTGALNNTSDTMTPSRIDDRSMLRTDPSGKFVYVLATPVSNPPGPGKAEILGYTFDRSMGKLTLIPGSPFQENVPAAVFLDNQWVGHDGLVITQ
jgi:6-phosphogluconolactonase